MTIFTFANNINTTLAGTVSTSATTITLSSTANLPASIPAGEVLVITLNDVATRQNFEVMYATARTGSTLTVLRGQEGTAALAWLTGDFAYSPPTAGQQESFGQLAEANTWTGNNAFTQPVAVPNAVTANEAVPLGQLTQVGVIPGRWLSRVIYAAAGTYAETPPATATLALYDVNGGGGGGGGAFGTASGQIAAGTGGGAGGRALKRVVNPTTQTVTVGAAGAGAVGATSGGAGGTSSVGVLVSATGGAGGSAGTAGTSGTNSGALGGSGAGGDINAPGANGFGPFGIASANIVKSGMGGSSPYGQGGLEQTTYATGGAAVGNSAGGAGGSVPPNNAAGASGGAGTPGIVVIDYFS